MAPGKWLTYEYTLWLSCETTYLAAAIMSLARIVLPACGIIQLLRGCLLLLSGAFPSRDALLNYPPKPMHIE